MFAGGAGGACWACANRAADPKSVIEMAERTIVLRIVVTSLGHCFNAVTFELYHSSPIICNELQ
jgi:hypothetical protein